MTSLGDNIKKLREENGVSQAGLAKAAGITSSALCQIESGTTKSLKAETLLKIGKALKVDPDRLIKGRASASELPTDEIQLLNSYRELPCELKGIAIRLLDALKSR